MAKELVWIQGNRRQHLIELRLRERRGGLIRRRLRLNLCRRDRDRQDACHRRSGRHCEQFCSHLPPPRRAEHATGSPADRIDAHRWIASLRQINRCAAWLRRDSPPLHTGVEQDQGARLRHGLSHRIGRNPSCFFVTIMTTNAILADHLTKVFGEGEARTVAVDDVSLDVTSGQMLYIVGPSGSGKTTLLSMISGILRPTSGRVLVKGMDIWGMSASEDARFRLANIGFVFQDYHLFPRLTTAENVAIPLVLRGIAWDAALTSAKKYLGIVGLETRCDLPPVKLSGGEQQRVAIARAIVTQPDILILDEPTASLDGDTGRNIVSFVKANLLSPERAIVIVTHDARIYEFANTILHMEDGKLSAQGENDDV
ncbi:MAG TPA: ABC transporter ATP-binding protein [Caulobacteraceae bacterium]|nr:ABC transporter ATP-binding protein [Caulobacteraceae bacterium]